MRRVLAALAALVLLALPGAPVGADEPWPSPTLSTPPDGLRGHALWDSWHELEPFAYEEQEYFVSGTARNAAGATAAYTTRIIVARPSHPADFNGAVLLDWVNVTAQFENAVDTMLTRQLLLREGFAYVHVSAQAAGICCTPLLTPKTWDPVRYAALSHPGDGYAHDMFTQVARAFEAPAGVDPLATLRPRFSRVLAAGQSQSANQLKGYVGSWLPANPQAIGVVDGVLLHGNVPGDKGWGAAAPIPVLHLLSDYEAVADGIDPASVGPNYRLWEVAGAAHADYWIGYQSIAGHGPRVLAGAPKADLARYHEVLEGAGNYGEQATPLHGVCTAAGATMPLRYAASSALHQLDRWVADVLAPPTHRPAFTPRNGPRFSFDGTRLASDELGNTLGGIRLPPMDVPVARYRSTTCQLGGITIPLTEVELVQRHGDHATYYARMAERTDAAVVAGWMLPEDAADLMRRACGARNRFPLSSEPCAVYVPPPAGV